MPSACLPLLVSTDLISVIPSVLAVAQHVPLIYITPVSVTPHIICPFFAESDKGLLEEHFLEILTDNCSFLSLVFQRTIFLL